MGSDRMRVALVTPPYHSGVVESAGRWPNVAFVYFAGALRDAGFEPVIYDAMTMGHDLPRIVTELERIRPDVLLTSAYTASYPAAARMTRAAKEALPSLVTGIGGVHAHFMYEEVLTCDGDAFDFVARGEGENTLPELMSCLQAGDDPSKVAGLAFLRGGTVVATPARPFVHDLDSLRPAWDLVDWSIYEFYPMPDTNLAIVSSSRGCDRRRYSAWPSRRAWRTAACR